MKKKKIKSENFIYLTILFSLIVILINNNNIIKKTYKIMKSNDLDKRLESAYGYCSKTSVGYIRYIKKEFQLDFNPKIINFKSAPKSDWTIYDLNYKDNNKKLLLLNYKPKFEYLFKNIDNKYWIYQEIIKGVDSIESIQIFPTNRGNKKIENTLFIYKTNTKNQKKLIYKKKINQILNNEVINIDFDTTKLNNTSHEKIIIEFKDPSKINIGNILLIGKNSFNMSEFTILDKKKDCYYVSSRN
jgi:hypothetical protein